MNHIVSVINQKTKAAYILHTHSPALCCQRFYFHNLVNIQRKVNRYINMAICFYSVGKLNNTSILQCFFLKFFIIFQPPPHQETGKASAFVWP
ncbi:hypothetical protein EB796_018065 [Bugula neritina]|uniref:Uncharacterized protein n=1 Tax=Bugula neritina TaxID=10212 RepID=A0A7J7JDB1_BUGNE|nr:hypothetical protein EB796_018065 [Bugula neritina]